MPPFPYFLLHPYLVYVASSSFSAESPCTSTPPLTPRVLVPLTLDSPLREPRRYQNQPSAPFDSRPPTRTAPTPPMPPSPRCEGPTSPRRLLKQTSLPLSLLIDPQITYFFSDKNSERERDKEEEAVLVAGVGGDDWKRRGEPSIARGWWLFGSRLLISFVW